MELLKAKDDIEDEDIQEMLDEYYRLAKRKGKIIWEQEFIGKDRRKELLYYVNLIRACLKVLHQLVYIGKKVCIP